MRSVFDVQAVAFSAEEIEQILKRNSPPAMQLLDLKKVKPLMLVKLRKYRKDDPEEGAKVVPLNAPFKLQPEQITP